MDINTKILVGSIGAVAILILVSFTNVVSVQSTTSDSVNESPLFCIRTKKTIDEENLGVLTLNYLGKENNLKLFIPSSNNEKVLLRKAIDRLQGMDDVTFTKFLENVLRWLTTQDRYKDVNVPQLIFTLYQIKENPEIFGQYLANDNDDLTEGSVPTEDIWFPGCYLLEVIAHILVSIFLIIHIIIFPTVIPTCFSCGPHLYL